MSRNTSFYNQSAQNLARNLIGCTLQRTLPDGTILAGIICETEAYIGPEDRASHAFGGRRTKRNESMWAKPGTAYVYFTYGMHFCFNVSCVSIDHPGAVLIRAIEPTIGIDRMRENRNTKPRKTLLKDRDLCNGPAKLCQALQIDGNLDGEDLLHSSQLTILQAGKVPNSQIRQTPRIGIAYAQEWKDKPLRWVRIMDP